jgi:hypothetical protein
MSRRLFGLAALVAIVSAGQTARAQDSTAVPLGIGSFNGSLRGSGVRGVTDQTRYSGSIYITPSTTGRPGVYKVEIQLSSSGMNSNSSATNQLQWSISPGRCNSRVQFLLPPSELPALELRSGGNAEVKWEGTITLTPMGTYQLMVYDKGLREDDVVACANLKYSAPKK